MFVIPARSAVAAIGAAVLAGVVFAAPAAAADAPLPGTADCTELVAPVVDADEVVVEARADLATLIADPDFVAVENQKLLDLQAALNVAINTATIDATAERCTGPDETTTTAPTPTSTVPSTTTAPVEDPEPGADGVFVRIAALIDGLSCDRYNEESGAITEALSFDTFQLLGAERFGALQDRLDARNRALGFCSGTTAPSPPRSVVVNGDVNVNPLDDDDSVADVDGTQVRVVPDGSVSTGGA